MDGRRLALTCAIALVVGACSPAPSPTASGAAPSPAPSDPVGPTAGPTDSGQPGSTSPPTQPPVTPARWADCGKGFQCASILAPRDYADPGGPSVRLALVRLPASDRTERIGSLVVNPGGPGASGIDFVREGAETTFSKEIRSRFDIVGFDPRGVNASSPVRCVDDLDHFLALDAMPDDAAELATLVNGAKEFTAGCERRNADLLPFLGTENVARDLDRIRQAIGDEKLTYVGFSYGTLIGAMYADRFPDRVRALVLDGALDPTLDLVGFRSGQAVGFEKAFDRFLAWCAGDRSCLFHGGGKPGPAFDALMRRIEKEPLRAIRARDRRRVGPTYAWSAVAGALYVREAWPALAGALALAELGDGSLFLLLADPYNGRRPHGGYSNLIDANTAVVCLDFPGPRAVEPYEKLATTLARMAPRFGSLLAYTDVDCAFWPVAPDRVPAPITAPGAPPVVVVGTTGDPATPYDWAVALADQLDSGVLVTFKGEGHTAYAQSTCVDKAVNAYLLKLAVPKDGLICAR